MWTKKKKRHAKNVNNWECVCVCNTHQLYSRSHQLSSAWQNTKIKKENIDSIFFFNYSVYNRLICTDKRTRDRKMIIDTCKSVQQHRNDTSTQKRYSHTQRETIKRICKTCAASRHTERASEKKPTEQNISINTSPSVGWNDVFDVHNFICCALCLPRKPCAHQPLGWRGRDARIRSPRAHFTPIIKLTISKLL